jgi:hypothetical protein
MRSRGCGSIRRNRSCLSPHDIPGGSARLYTVSIDGCFFVKCAAYPVASPISVGARLFRLHNVNVVFIADLDRGIDLLLCAE